MKFAVHIMKCCRAMLVLEDVENFEKLFKKMVNVDLDKVPQKGLAATMSVDLDGNRDTF